MAKEKRPTKENYILSYLKGQTVLYFDEKEKVFKLVKSYADFDKSERFAIRRYYYTHFRIESMSNIISNYLYETSAKKEASLYIDFEEDKVVDIQIL